MANFELVMPQMGESIAEASITSWLKEIGDTIEIEEAILEIATDKIDTEIPSPVQGKLIKKLFKVNDNIKVGQPIAIIDIESEVNNTSILDNDTKTIKKLEKETSNIKRVTSTNISTKTNNKTNHKITSDKFYSPLVRSIAKTEGISVNELDNIKGSGNDGRINKNDILEYIQNRNHKTSKKPINQDSKSVKIEKIQTNSSTQIVNISANDEIIEMDKMRKIISENMTTSLRTSAHVTSFVEADVTNIVNWRNRIKDNFAKKERQKITFTPIFIEAVIKAIKDFPLINSSVDGDKIIKKSNINIGMAAALPNGNLIVPVIRNADTLNLLGLTKAVNDLANRARNNNLKPDEIQGGTFTLTNIGSFGNIMGTPIIKQPQVAILAVGTIIKKPSVIETPQGDSIGIRHKMFLSHSYDHRIIDGGLGGMFVKRVAEYLETFDINRTFAPQSYR